MLSNKERVAIGSVATRWILTEEELSAVWRYLRGKRLCRDFDKLSEIVQQAVDEVVARGKL